MGETIIAAIAVVAIFLIVGVSINGIVDKVMVNRRLRHEAKAGTQGQDMRALIERQQQFEDRLRVLERIATDRGNLLADEIEALRRDTPAIAMGQREAEVAAQ
jgi:hypothetical protein